MSKKGQEPIPGGVFGSAGAEVCGTFYRKYDPVDGGWSGLGDAVLWTGFGLSLVAAATLPFWLPWVMGS